MPKLISGVLLPYLSNMSSNCRQLQLTSENTSTPGRKVLWQPWRDIWRMVPWWKITMIVIPNPNDKETELITINFSVVRYTWRCPFHAYHGVLPQETQVGQRLCGESGWAMISPEPWTDELRGTLNYAELYELVKQEMEIPSKLLEHVAGQDRKATLCRISDYSKIQLAITKVNPPWSRLWQQG